MDASSIPVIDFSQFDSPEAGSRQRLIKEVEEACRTYGFFTLINHGIPRALQQDLLACSEEFFSLPLDIKKTYNKDIGGFNRGYERLRAQNFEKGPKGDLKEGYYFGLDLPLDHPNVLANKFSQGPNKYPQHVKDTKAFQTAIDTYFNSMRSLAEKLFRIICETLDVKDDWIPEYVDTPIAVLRLLHYPPQPPDASELERGIGAHTDFGAITMLLQDSVGGLQVWNRTCSSWIDVHPIPDSLVVNLGNLMMRWTNDRYVSNLHRVINKSGKERYSVPFFFSGNPDFVVRCFEQCEGRDGAKYGPIKVGDWIRGRYVDTYGAGEGGGEALADLGSAASR